jgi:hypothetical protein
VTDPDLDASASDADDTSDGSLGFDAESGLDDLDLAIAPEADGQDAAASDDTDFDVFSLGDGDLDDDGAALADSELDDLDSESASDELFGGPEDSAVDADSGDLDLDLGTFDDVTDESDSLDDLNLDGDDGSEFDDLDAMLAEDTTDVSPESLAIDEPVADATDEFGELDALLDDDTAVTETNAAISEVDVDFDELDALIGDPDTPATAATAPTSSDAAGDDFGDLEKLLEEADQTLGGGATSLRSPGPGRSTRRVGGIVDQTMRVSVKHLDNLNNLVGELVVNRNSLEQDQDRFRQFLDNLLFQVQQLNDVGQRMRDLYERSLLESSLLASRQAFHSGGSAYPPRLMATMAIATPLERALMPWKWIALPVSTP